MKRLIEEIYISTINKKFVSENHCAIRKFLLEHPLRFTMFDNLEHEIKKSGVVLDGMIDMERKRDAIKSMVESLTLFFAKTAIDVKEKEIKNAPKERIQQGDDFEKYCD
jgi:hypothetical protein